jgi:threonine/homoserine/homoserine lactone efflux protein
VTASHLVAFNLALIAAILSPGPALLVAIRTTLSTGRGAGIGIGIGLGLMAATWTMAALLGFDAAFRLFPWAYAGAKALGALYLIYIAYRMWRGARNPIEAQNRLARNAFQQGILINLLNPKSVLFAAAVLIVVFPSQMTFTENAVVVGNHLIVEFVFYTMLAFAMSSELVSTRYLRAKVYLDRGASLILGALGIRLLTHDRDPTLLGP